MYKTDNCCCCATLRTGTLIIGWLQLIVSALNIISGIVYKINGTSSQDSVVVNSLSNNDVFWPNMVTSVLSFILAFSLLYGVYTNRKRFIYYYLYVSVFLLVIKIIITIVAIFMGTFDQVAVTVCGNILSWALTVYLLIVVYSFHEELAGNN